MQLEESEHSQNQMVTDPRFGIYTREYVKQFNEAFPELNVDQIERAALFCQQRALERIKREDEMAKQADNDFLTDLLNRRGFNKHITQRLHQYRREVQSNRTKPEEIKASILYLDLDSFKRVNDTYDHATGDDVLKAFSEVLKKMRPTDIAARVGGEEFAVFLDGEGSEGAILTADRARTATSDLFHERFPDLDWPKTVSCGVYQLPPFTGEQLESGKDWQYLITLSTHYADLAHKTAKAAGKNKVGVMFPNGQTGIAIISNPHEKHPKIKLHYPFKNT